MRFCLNKYRVLSDLKRYSWWNFATFWVLKKALKKNMYKKSFRNFVDCNY